MHLNIFYIYLSFQNLGTPPVIRRADLFNAHRLTQQGPDRQKVNYSDTFLYIEPTGTRFASGLALLLIQSFPFHLFAGLCVLTPLPREGNAVAKGGRGQLALLQVVFHNPTFHFGLCHPLCIRRADLFIAHIQYLKNERFRPRQNPPLGRKSTG
ncbi:MAG: hypothetical protein EZS28_009885 [Streblomastix strix]|uniref:Uncharacterized protein n=1 Tax=Streblomastix strix TaxID=222440 RepID=A0A5J4WI89_9EUKA|nr:MAG: hypothetical protein EZS28_009885 [Streblomastix strix]